MLKKKKLQYQAKELLEALTDFTSNESWDKFFAIRGSKDSFEWYAEWPELKDSLLQQLRALNDAAPDSLQILVPGCGSSKLSEHLYDAGFLGIMNIDFSKVVISYMLRRNVRERPAMRWRVMDMTSMKFPDNVFDVVIDKAGLDALMEPGHGEKLGNQYLTEAKRVLKTGGKFVCLTLAESNVLGLLLPKLRFGWKMAFHAIPKKQPGTPSLQTFMVVAEKENNPMVHQITLSFAQPSNSSDEQVNGLLEQLNNENRVRVQYSDVSNALFSLKDLQLGAKGGLENLIPGRRVLLILGDESSRFSYRAVLLDARRDSQTTFKIRCVVMLVPESRADGWLYSSEEGQWEVVQNVKAARLILVCLESAHRSVTMEDLKKNLSPLVNQLAPRVTDYGSRVPFLFLEDAIKERKIVHQVSSPLTGPIIIEDVVYNETDDDISQILPGSWDSRFRRLIFHRNELLVQSEALLTIEEGAADESRGRAMIFHDYLVSPYLSGTISGLMLISSHLEAVASAGNGARAVVIGLGAGLIPTFLRRSLPFALVEAVELDPVIVKLARDYFGFSEDSQLKVHTADGIQFVRELARNADGSGSVIDVLIVDVDSDLPSSGLSCPAPGFLEEAFLHDARASMSDRGLFVVNLVSRSAPVKEAAVSRMKDVFNHLYSLRVEKDMNEIIFALKTDGCMKEDTFLEAALQLEKLLHCREPKTREAIVDASKKIKQLK